MKCALIATCMLENNYLIEWVEYYKKIGVDKIFLGDNNPINGEHPQEVLQEYIESDFVEIINYNECEGVAQTQTFDDMYNAHKNEYDWFLFF